MSAPILRDLPAQFETECLVDVDNTSSRRVCEQTGFQLEGVLRNERISPEGVLRHTCMYAIAP